MAKKTLKNLLKKNDGMVSIFEIMHDALSSNSAIWRRRACYFWYVFYKVVKRDVLKEIMFLANNDPDQDVRGMAFAVLGEVRNTSALPELVNGLKDEDEEVRIEAAFAIEKFGKRANKKYVIDALLQAINDKDSGIDIDAITALIAIRSEEAMLVIEEILNNENYKHLWDFTQEQMSQNLI